MRVRFHIPEADPAESDARLTVRYAPARRPRLRHLRWYVLVSVLSLLAGALVLGSLGGVLCR